MILEQINPKNKCHLVACPERSEKEIDLTLVYLNNIIIKIMHIVQGKGGGL